MSKQTDLINVTDAITVDGSNNVGIGTSSPSAVFDVRRGDADGKIAEFHQSSGYGFELSSSTSVATITSGYNQAFVFETGTTATERMRIDTSGNLLVANTTPVIFTSSSITGHNIAASGSVQHNTDGETTMYLNRLTSDGTILDFRKDGTAVGSIGTQGSRLSIGSGDVNLNFNASANSMYPISDPAAGTLSDGVIDVGAATGRFKDLYLSGGVYLGGTGSANKLDDVETGTWTPTITSSSGTITTLSGQSGVYTKVGKAVTLQFQFVIDTLGSAGGTLLVTNLPFARETSVLTYYGGFWRARSGTSSIAEINPSNTAYLYGASPIVSTYFGSLFYKTA